MSLCLFQVMVLCLAVFIGNWSPFSSTLSPESPVDSHSLHSLDTSFTSFHGMSCEHIVVTISAIYHGVYYVGLLFASDY